MLERDTEEQLSKLLLDVALLRKQGSTLEFLQALLQGALLFPVFARWPAPVDDWLDEAERLSRELGQDDTLGLLAIRRAVVTMRRGDVEGALLELERLEPMLPVLPPGHRAWAAITRARLLSRSSRSPAARERLDGVTVEPDDDWLVGVLRLAEGEVWIEGGDLARAEDALAQAWQALAPELVEERVTCLQALGFAAIARVDVATALSWLDQARQMLRGAGAWLEVAQMNVATASLLTSRGEQGAAQSLFREAVELAAEHDSPELETLARLGLTRSLALDGQAKEAVTAALAVSAAQAKRGDLVGFVSAVVMISRLYADQENYQESYRTLATGLAIANQRGWTAVASVMRTHTDRLRDEMGAQRFDSMVQSMLDELRRARTH